MASASTYTQTTFKLVLDESEAIVLLDIVRSIAGSRSGPRGQADAISTALLSAGVRVVNQDTHTGRDSIEYLRSFTALS